MAGDGRRARDGEGEPDDERAPTGASAARGVPGPAPGGTLRAHLITVDGREECTLAPADPDEGERLCAWLTAVEESFVALDEVR